MRIWGYVALAAALSVVLGTGLHWVYNAGYTAAIAEQQELAIDMQNRAIEQARREWESTRGAAEAEIVVEERIVEVIREVEREVPRVVEKIVEVKPECRDLGAEYAGLLNAAVNASNSRENGSPAAPAELDDGL